MRKCACIPVCLVQIANVVRGLGAVGYHLPPQLTLRLAASLIAKECAALHYVVDLDARDLAYGFAQQVKMHT